MLDGSRMSRLSSGEKILRRTATRIAQKKIRERVNETIQLTSVHLTATVLNFNGLSPGLAYL